MEEKGREGKNLGNQMGKIKASKDREKGRDKFVGEGG